MKKTISTLLALCLITSLLFGCVPGKAPSRSQGESSESEELLTVGTTATLGDWEITLESFETLNKISDGLMAFVPNEGNLYVSVNLTIKNNGTEPKIFWPTIATGKYIHGKIIYQGQYEYSADNLLGHDEELHDKHLNPLSSASGILAFSIPSDIADSEELVLEISYGRESLKFALK